LGGVIRTSFEDAAIVLEEWKNKFAEYPTRPHLNFVTGTLFGQPTAENERAAAREGLLCPSQTVSEDMR
jgi:hypothetical protein